jgi:hypothetical protein
MVETTLYWSDDDCIHSIEHQVHNLFPHWFVWNSEYGIELQGVENWEPAWPTA